MAVEALRVVPLHEEVYNLELEAIHTYAVGNNEVLVHNSNGEGAGDPVWNAAAQRWQDPATGRFMSGYVVRWQQELTRVDTIAAEMASRGFSA